MFVLSEAMCLMLLCLKSLKAVPFEKVTGMAGNRKPETGKKTHSSWLAVHRSFPGLGR